MEFKMILMKARTAKGLSQKQLAQQINEKQTVIGDYEAGRAIPNPQIIAKLSYVTSCFIVMRATPYPTNNTLYSTLLCLSVHKLGRDQICPFLVSTATACNYLIIVGAI